MRLVEWAEFKTMPSGTIFQEWKPHWLGSLKILGSTCDIDFVDAELTPMCVDGNSLGKGHWAEKEFMLISMPSSFGRDGMFDLEDRRWLVWDDRDCRQLAEWLMEPKKAVDQQNEDGKIYVVPEKDWDISR